MMTASTSSFLLRHVWLPFVTLLIGFTLPSSLGADTLGGWGDADRWPPFAAPLQAPARLGETQRVAQRTAEPPMHLDTTKQPGRPGVTEYPGRLGVTEQPGRPGAGTGHAPPAPMPPVGRTKPMIVKALLNGQVSVPLMLDTGATHTVLTRHTAQALGFTGLERLPKQPFLTASGEVFLPVITLQSIRVETAEVKEIEAAVDIKENLPVGLLGMTFLRHFKVTVDQEQDQVTFEKRLGKPIEK